MKVLLLTTHLEMGGIPIYIVELARGLKQRGHVPIVVSAGGGLERRLTQEGIAHYRVPCRTSSELNPKLWVRVFPQLLKLIRREHPDLLHAHTRVTQVLAWACHTVTRIPFVTTCHGLYRFRIGRRFFRCWGRWVMAISGATMERLVRQYKLAPPHQVILVRNGVDVDRFLQPVGDGEVAFFKQANGLNGDPLIGAIARLSPIKGLDLLLKAVPPLLNDFPRLQVLLVGDGPAKGQLVRLAYELGIADRVVISHPVEDTRVPLAVIQLFVAPAGREGFGLAIVEAMAAGVPVVATDSGGPAEILDGGKCGLLIPTGDPQAIEKGLRVLLQDPVRRGRMIEQARERARSQFDMRRVVREVETVYAQAVP